MDLKHLVELLVYISTLLFNADMNAKLDVYEPYEIKIVSTDSCRIERTLSNGRKVIWNECTEFIVYKTDSVNFVSMLGDTLQIRELHIYTLTAPKVYIDNPLIFHPPKDLYRSKDLLKQINLLTVIRRMEQGF